MSKNYSISNILDISDKPTYKLKITNKEKRNELLKKKLKELKLNNIDEKLCRTYIILGKPNLDSVIQTLIKIHEIENNRLYKLCNKLKNNGYEYNDKIPAFKKYIKYGGKLSKTINDYQLEKILIDNTNYLSMINLTDTDTAKQICINELSEKNIISDKINRYTIIKNRIIFE